MSAIHTLRREVAKLTPGQRVNFDWHMLDCAQPRVPVWARLNGGPSFWPVPDQVLTGILGSGKEFGYSEDLLYRHITFWRLDKPIEGDCWTYIDPDRRDGWVKSPDDIWRRAP